MKKNIQTFLLLALIVFGTLIMWKNNSKNCSRGLCGALPAALAENSDLRKSDFPAGTEVMTFVELGSVNCIPCKQMQPIMDEIENEYKGKVRVVFHDVWTEEGRKYGNEYHVRVIPTQVFLDKTGKEITRHEGFFPKSEIENIFSSTGVEK